MVYIITRMYVDSVSAGDNSIYSGCFGTTAAADVEVFYGGPWLSEPAMGPRTGPRYLPIYGGANKHQHSRRPHVHS